MPSRLYKYRCQAITVQISHDSISVKVFEGQVIYNTQML